MNQVPTPRQLEALWMIYHGHSISERKRRDGEVLSRRSAGTGGAVWRMRDRMGDAGWLVEHTSKRGRTYWEQKLSVAGLKALAVKYPDLDGFAERLKEAERAELEAFAAAERQAQADRDELAASRTRRREGRIAAFRELMQSYQVRHDLTDDQILELWVAIVDKEMSL